MGLIELVLVLVILGVGMYFVETYVPMATPFRVLIRAIVAIVIVLWLLQVFGIVGPAVPRVSR